MNASPFSGPDPDRTNLVSARASDVFQAKATPEETATRSRAVNLLKGLSILAVITTHLASRFLAPEVGDWLRQTSQLLQWATPSFIVAAGFLYGLGRKRYTQSWLEFFGHRSVRLLTPFVLVSLAYAALYGVVRALGLFPGIDSALPWWTRWFNTLVSSNDRIGEQLYFLPYLLLVSAASVALVRLLRHPPYLLVAALLITATSRLYPEAYQALPLHPPYRPWDMFFSSVGMFLFGYLFLEKPSWRLPVLGLAMPLCIAAGIANEYLVYRYAGALAVGALLIHFSPSVPFLEWVGERSGTLFLYHTPIVAQPMLYYVGRYLPPSAQLVAVGLVLLVVVLSLGRLHDFLIRSGWKRLTFG